MFGRGVFIIPITKNLGWDRGVLSGAFAMSQFVAGPMSILTGRLCDRYGPRILLTVYGCLVVSGFILMSRVISLWQVYLIWGLFIGLGSSCCFTPIMSTIPKWFLKHRGSAVGFTLIGFGIGGIIWPTVTQGLISAYGWRQTYLIAGIIAAAVIIPLAQFIKQNPQKMGIKPYGETEPLGEIPSPDKYYNGMSFIQAIRSRQFWLLSIVLFFFWILIQIVFVHVVPYAIDMGIAEMAAASILSIIAAVSLVGRISMGYISGKIGIRWALPACLSLATLALIWLIFAQNVWMFYLFAVVFGLAYGGFVPLETIVPSELFGIKAIGVILGAIFLSGTIGSALGPIFAGVLFEATGSYVTALQICVVVNIIGIVIAFIVLRLKE